MALLTSQIPILYCLMYLQSNRRPASNHSNNNTLLHAITSQRRHFALPRTFQSHPTKRDSSSSTELFEHKQSLMPTRRESARRLTPSSVEEERSWVRHQAPDPRQLCLERYSHVSQINRSYSRKSKNNFQTNENCSRNPENTIRQIISERLMTPDDLLTLLPEITKNRHNGGSRPNTRYKTDALPYANLKTSIENHCGACNTEIGYEVMTHIQDFKGMNYTVINFDNAYQFIPAGRCINANSLCGGGGNARCVQIYRAQWTLVWDMSSGGTRLVAHEVPSHCQCVNVGSPLNDSVKSHAIKAHGEAEPGVASADDSRARRDAT